MPATVSCPAVARPAAVRTMSPAAAAPRTLRLQSPPSLDTIHHLHLTNGKEGACVHSPGYRSGAGTLPLAMRRVNKETPLDQGAAERQTNGWIRIFGSPNFGRIFNAGNPREM